MAASLTAARSSGATSWASDALSTARAKDAAPLVSLLNSRYEGSTWGRGEGGRLFRT